MRVRVYTASKLDWVDRWRALIHQWRDDVEFTARWTVCGVLPDLDSFAPIFWDQIVEDIRGSDAVLVAPPGHLAQHLRGALVEVGMALAMGKWVVIFGDHDDYGTWQFHPRVVKVADLDEARQALVAIARRPL